MKVAFFDEKSPAIEWNELARKICKRAEENKLTNQQVLDEIDESEEDYDEDDETTESSNESVSESNAELVPPEPKEKTTKKPISSTKAPKEKSTAKPKATTSVPPSVIDSNNENDESEADDDYDYSNELDDDEDREDESIKSDDKTSEKNKILFEGIKVIKEIDTRIFGKLSVLFVVFFDLIMISFEGGDDNGDETEDVIIEEASTNYRFIWPMLIVMLSIVIVLLIIMNVIVLCMRKRGERYRQALLRSKTDSIVYQKLSEEITPQTPKVHRYVITPVLATSQTPKAHRYTPIEQV